MSCESSVIPMASWPIWARWRIQGFATPLNQVLMFSFLSLLVDFNLSSIIDPLKDDERWKTKAYTFFGSFGSSAPQNVKFITRSDRMNWWHHSKPVCPPVGVCWLQSLVKVFPTFPSSFKLPYQPPVVAFWGAQPAGAGQLASCCRCSWFGGGAHLRQTHSCCVRLYVCKWEGPFFLSLNNNDRQNWGCYHP